jgi:hypothetical protein
MPRLFFDPCLQIEMLLGVSITLNRERARARESEGERERERERERARGRDRYRPTFFLGQGEGIAYKFGAVADEHLDELKTTKRVILSTQILCYCAKILC